MHSSGELRSDHFGFTVAGQPTGLEAADSGQ